MFPSFNTHYPHLYFFFLARYGSSKSKVDMGSIEKEASWTSHTSDNSFYG